MRKLETRRKPSFEMTLTGIKKHVHVLEEAGLVSTLEDLRDSRTKVLITALFHTAQERDGMLRSGMEQGLNQSYAALDKVLATLG